MTRAVRQGWTRWLCRALLGAALLLSGAAHALDARIGDTVALPVLSTVDGGRVTAEALRGKLVVLAYFASYCPFCMQEAPKLQKLYRENSDRLVVIGVNIEHGDPEQAAKVGKWIAKYGLTYPVTTDYPALERVLGKIKGLPVLQVIDRSGVLRQVEVGEMLDEDYGDIAGFARALDALPPMADLHADGQQAQRANKPLVLFFSLSGCQYCEVVRRNYLLPLLRDASENKRPVIREADIESDAAIVGIDGAATTPKQLAARYHVRVAPTVVFVDGEGRLLTAPLAGGDTSGMYGAYLDNAFEEAQRKLSP